MEENTPAKNIAQIFDCDEEFVKQMAEIAFGEDSNEGSADLADD